MSDSRSSVQQPIEDGRVCEAVVLAVSRVRDVDPLEINPPLYDVIDPDALERLFRNTASTARAVESTVTFTMAECEVTVTDEQVVYASPQTAHEA